MEPEAVAVALAGVNSQLQEQTKTLTTLVTHVETQNHRIDKLEHFQVKQQGVEEERARWHDRQASSTRWLFGFGMTSAGVLSGVVFGAVQVLLRVLG